MSLSVIRFSEIWEICKQNSTGVDVVQLQYCGLYSLFMKNGVIPMCRLVTIYLTVGWAGSSVREEASGPGSGLSLSLW